jgi:hypothetical protein
LNVQLLRAAVPGLLAATTWWLVVAGVGFGALVRISILFVLLYVAVTGANWAAFLVGIGLILIGVTAPLSALSTGPNWLIAVGLLVTIPAVRSGRKILSLRPALASNRSLSGPP